jgi:hypothetical protein
MAAVAQRMRLEGQIMPLIICAICHRRLDYRDPDAVVVFFEPLRRHQQEVAHVICS